MVGTHPRPGDPDRPELTTTRIRELLDAVPRIHERDSSIGRFLFQPAAPDSSRQGARKVLGKNLAAVVEEITGDAQAFARDLFWLHAIAFRLRNGGTIDQHLAQAEALAAPDAWKPLASRRRESMAEAVAGVVPMLQRISRNEEACVRGVVDDVLAMFFRYRQIR